MALLLAAAMYILLAPVPKLPVGTANGTYFNACCGRVVLRDGLMLVGDEQVRYVVEEDKLGGYVLPLRSVPDFGPAGLHINVDTKLRLDSDQHPASITFLGTDTEHRFAKV